MTRPAASLSLAAGRNAEPAEKAAPAEMIGQDGAGQDDVFKGIRHNRNTKLENQQQALSLLDAIEAVLREKGLAFSCENYFDALWPLLDNEKKEAIGGMGRGKATGFNTSNAYLLSFVVPRMHRESLRERYSQIYEKLPGCLQRFILEAPLVRSGLVILEGILCAFDAEAWGERASLNDLLMVVLQFAVDARPKVRKGAQDVIMRMVREDLIGGIDHSAMSSLMCFLAAILEGATRKDSTNAIHIVPLLRSLSGRFSSEHLSSIVAPLLRCAALGNNHLTTAIFNVIAYLCECSREGALSSHLQRGGEAGHRGGRLTVESRMALVEGLLRVRPEVHITDLAPSWIAVFSKAIRCLHSLSPIEDAAMIAHFGTLFGFFLSEDARVTGAMEEALRATYCIVAREPVAAYIGASMASWMARKNAPQMPFIIRSIGDYCDESGCALLPAMEPLLRSLVEAHDSKQAKHAGLIEKALGRYVARCGPEAIMAIAPLALEGGAGERPRAWLLSVLRDAVSHAPIGYFAQALHPLAERLSAKADEYEDAGKDNDAKVYRLIVHQIWATFPAFMTFPTDFAAVFPSLAPILGQKVNDVVSLRPLILNALTAFIKRSRSFESDVDSLPPFHHREGEEEALSLEGTLNGREAIVARDMQVLASFAPNFLPLLFNIYSSTSSGERIYILQGIEAFLSISEGATVAMYFDRVLEKVSNSVSGEDGASILELLSALVRTLDIESFDRLFGRVLAFIDAEGDIVVQKRAYRLLSDLLGREDFATELVSRHFDGIERSLLDSYASNLNPAVKKGRFQFLLRVSGMLADDQLHLILLFLPEAILGTKEVNQKARLLAFELVLAWARRMSRGGRIVASRTEGMLQTDKEASLDEYLTMLVAGLAGTTPHMISGTIMALARVIYELSGGISEAILSTLLGDIISVLKSPNREVIKSALGFIKVFALSPLTTRIVEGHLRPLISAVLVWSNEHQHNFKMRVRHLMERLVRRFGVDRIMALTPASHQKIIANVRKRKERLKRRKDEGASGSGDGKDASDHEDADYKDGLDAYTDAALSRTTMMTRNTGATGMLTKKSSRFEAALNDSESDLSDDDAAFHSASHNGGDDYELAHDSILHDIDLDADDDAIDAILDRKLTLANALIAKRPRKLSSRAAVGGGGGEEVEDDGTVTVGADGRMMFSEAKGLEDEDEDSDDSSRGSKAAKGRRTSPAVSGGGKGGAGSKRVHFQHPSSSSGRIQPPPSKADRSGSSSIAKKGRPTGGDAKRSTDKHQPFSYMPMARATKKRKGGADSSRSGAASSSSQQRAAAPRKSGKAGHNKYFLKRT